MEDFIEYLEEKIESLKKETEKFNENYRQDDAVFVKIKMNVYNVCKTVFEVFKKVKPESALYNEYIMKLDEFEENWSKSADKAKEFGDAKKIAAEDIKLEALADIREKFIEVWGR